MEPTERLLLVGCGILRNEVRLLIAKNRWPVDTLLLDSALHCELDKLSRCLVSALAKNRRRQTVVFYGCCHPLMDHMLDDGRTFRTEGQNCLEMLLGTDVFTEELANGAFFLLEEWARRWEHILSRSFGTKNVDVIREIFRIDRKYLLCVRTPCSRPFSVEAEHAGQYVGLPIRWMDATLDHLELVLGRAIARRLGSGPPLLETPPRVRRSERGRGE